MAIYPVHGYVKGLLGMKLVYNQLRKEIQRRKLGLGLGLAHPLARTRAHLGLEPSDAGGKARIALFSFA
jgi:hypothetical protein